jgi:YidC/Oxa1 family membrane protein insertase
MLFFAYELRHEPAFWGFFQMFGEWKFLADLSQPDHFLGELTHPVKFLWMPITGFNLLPFLMGAVFFFQQKYMTPPTAATMSKEQQQQQKIMRVMMIVLFPVMLYSAPSGLTLYILTSSTIGIIESKYIRSHINEMDLKPPKPKQPRGKAKPRGAKGRAFAAAMQRMQEKRRDDRRGPENKFKTRR